MGEVEGGEAGEVDPFGQCEHLCRVRGGESPGALVEEGEGEEQVGGF
jgi:hypothetical protein